MKVWAADTISYSHWSRWTRLALITVNVCPCNPVWHLPLLVTEWVCWHATPDVTPSDPSLTPPSGSVCRAEGSFGSSCWLMALHFFSWLKASAKAAQHDHHVDLEHVDPWKTASVNLLHQLFGSNLITAMRMEIIVARSYLKEKK